MEEEKVWSAEWIWLDEEQAPKDGKPYRLVYFRRSFDVPEDAAVRLSVDVSADSRYRLYLNGEPVSIGPCRGAAGTHYYESVELTARLKPGRNVLAAKVLHFGKGSPHPDSVISSPNGAFLLQGKLMAENGNEVEDLSTSGGGQWRCRPDLALSLLPETHTCVGGGEAVDGFQLEHGWTNETFDDSEWPAAVKVSRVADPLYGALTPWQLAARTIPMPYEQKRSFVRLMRFDGDVDAGGRLNLGEQQLQAWVAGNEPLRLPAGAKLNVELDAGELTTGFLRLIAQGGRGSEIVFICAESYATPEGKKGVRDDPEGKVIQGYRESYRVVGAAEPQQEIYETFHYRTFRFVRLEITVGDEPLIFCSADYRETGYPLEVKASFASSDPTFTPLWDISVRTLQRCMYETYMDCPYYEQLQYSMDTRLQIWFTYLISGDDRLARKAIFDLHSSLLPSGMLLSRSPAMLPQVIPGFALFWIMIVHDHYVYWNDAELLKRYRPTIDAVLDWFERRTGEDGLVGPMPQGYWSFVDWVHEWQSARGAPVPGRRVPLTVYNLMYADALNKAADINERTGRRDTATEYRERANRTISAVKRHAYAEERKLFQDGPGIEEYSQHAQVWAVLSGAVQGEEARRLAVALAEDRSLLPVSYAMAFFYFRALSVAGEYDRSYPLWDMWRDQLKLNMTTWLEDPVSERSDCHAWGAVPLYEFPCEVLGVNPAAPGFARILIEPKPGPLQWAEGSAITPRGAVHVAWRIEPETGRFSLRASGLQGVPVEVRLPGGFSASYEGLDEIEI